MLPLAAILAALGPPITVQPSAAPGPAPGEQTSLHACFSDAGVGLLAWEDYRCNPLGDPCVLASRFDGTGQLLDPSTLQLATEGRHPRVGCGAQGAPSQFFVTWDTPNSDVWATPVASSGAVGAPFPVYFASGIHEDADIATDGTRYLVVWSESSGPTPQVFATVLDVDGGTLGIAHPIAGVGNFASRLRATSSGSEYLVTWLDGEAPAPLRALRVSSTGQAIGGQVSIAFLVDKQDVAFAGSWVVAWADGPNSNVLTRWLGPTLAGLGPDLQMNPTGIAAFAPSIAVRQGYVSLAWGQEDTSVRLAPLFGPSDAGPSIEVLPAVARDVILVNTPVGFVVGASETTGETDLFVRGLGGAPVPQRINAIGQVTPAVAAIGDTYFVVWRQEFDTGSHIMGRRIARDGTRLGAGPDDIRLDASGSLRQPTVVAAGQTWLVAWLDDLGVRGRRFDANGVALDATPRLLMPLSAATSGVFGLGSDGTQFLLVAMDDNGVLTGRRLSTAGTQLGGVLNITMSGSWDTVPFGVAGSPDAGFLVTWHGQDAFAARVTSGGVVVDPGGFLVTDGGDAERVAAGWDGQRFHVACTDSALYETALVGTVPVVRSLGQTVSNGDFGVDVHGATFATLDGPGLALAYSQSFQDAGGPTLRVHQLFVTYLRPDGSWDPPQTVADDLQPQSVVQIAAGATSRAYVWARMAAPPETTPIVTIRIETLALSGDGCALGHDCASGVCVSSRCVGPATPDAGPGDAGAMDAGAMDAGEMDAGEMDAGAMDAGEMDAGAMDAGAMDAGAMDAGTGDGGTGPTGYNVGCGCAASPGLLALAALTALALSARPSSRRRGARPRSAT